MAVWRLADDQATAGLEHAVHFGERRSRFVDVAETEADGDGIEFVVAERELLRICFHKFEFGMTTAPFGDPASREVESDNGCPRLGEGKRAGASTGSNVENAFAGLWIDGAHCGVTPQWGVASGQHVVGAVVVLGDVVKHASNFARLLAQIGFGHEPSLARKPYRYRGVR